MTDENDEIQSLNGQVALVTGGSAGIGRSIVDVLAGAGAKVVVVSRREAIVADVAWECAHQGYDVTGIATDVTDPNAVSELFTTVARRHGRLDILVNSAGGSFGSGFRRGPFLTLTDMDFIESFRLNVVGAALCSQAAVPLMRTTGGGSIVHISSASGDAAAPGFAAYGASKAALNNLTRTMALELAPDIRVNTVSPGSIDTERTTENRPPERVEYLLSRIALRRFGRPEDVAAAVLYLVSPSATWVTGAVFRIDGGYTPG